MDIKQMLLQQADHLYWADALIWKTVSQNSAASNNADIKKLMLHIHFTQSAFLRVWNKEPFIIPTDPGDITMQEVINSGMETHAGLKKFLSGIDNFNLDDLVEIPWSKWLMQKSGKEPAPLTLAESIQQVIMHSHYHRAQVNRMLRETGGEPRIMDYIAWVWLGKPEPEKF